ncbi:MAG: twin-arginine translocase subunit TatC [Treponema sp.]|nr:twin-arginine translocase subunit TatC [Treponema sp.]
MTKTSDKRDFDITDWVPHVAELRRRIIAVLVVFFVSTVTAFVFSSNIASFLLAPLARFEIPLYTFAPAEKFMTYLHLSFWTGVLCTVPFLCLQTAFFIWPGLRRNEYRYVCTALFVVPVLFMLGAALCYHFLAPIALNFFLSFAEGDGIRPLWGFREYLSLLFGLMLAGGLLSQGPLILLVLMVTGLVSYKTVARYRCHIILLIFLLAALLTPPDVVSQIMLGIPLYLLFEGSLFLGRIFGKR